MFFTTHQLLAVWGACVRFGNMYLFLQKSLHLSWSGIIDIYFHFPFCCGVVFWFYKQLFCIFFSFPISHIHAPHLPARSFYASFTYLTAEWIIFFSWCWGSACVCFLPLGVRMTCICHFPLQDYSIDEDAALHAAIALSLTEKWNRYLHRDLSGHPLYRLTSLSWAKGTCFPEFWKVLSSSAQVTFSHLSKRNVLSQHSGRCCHPLHRSLLHMYRGRGNVWPTCKYSIGRSHAQCKLAFRTWAQIMLTCPASCRVIVAQPVTASTQIFFIKITRVC